MTDLRRCAKEHLFPLAASTRENLGLRMPPSLGAKGRQMVDEMLTELSNLLHLEPLRLDEEGCTAIDYAGKCTLQLTYDPNTERIYLYSILLNLLPHDINDRLELYESLLEGSLLGRDMAGGGVGVSLRDNLCVMSTSVDVRTSQRNALMVVVPPFVASVLEWTDRARGHPAVQRAIDSYHTPSTPTPRTMVGQPGPSYHGTSHSGYSQPPGNSASPGSSGRMGSDQQWNSQGSFGTSGMASSELANEHHR